MATAKTDWDFPTKAVHAGIVPAEHQGATSIPIYESSSFAYDTADGLAAVFDGTGIGHVYSRISNPTVSVFEQRMNALEGGAGAVAAASGMAALLTAILALCAQGDEIVSSTSLFGGTFLLFEKVLRKFGIGVRYADPCDTKAMGAALSPRSRLLFVETIGNPRLDVPDVAALSGIAGDHGIPLLLDGTMSTPYLMRGKDHGAAVVIHSATKYITGSGSAIGGVIVDCGTFPWEKSRSADIAQAAEKWGGERAFLAVARKQILQNMGGCLSPFNAFLHCLGLETLALRMERHCANALALAEFLRDHPKVRGVNYPGLRESRFNAAAAHRFGGRFGGVLTFRLGTRGACFSLINRLRLVRNMTNLGDAKTLIVHPASTMFRDCSPEETARAGVTDDLLRVSVGIEGIKDIIADFDRALQEAS